MPDNHNELEPSPAEMGDTMTVVPGEWTPLDDHGTEIYLYGDQPVDIALQTADQDDEVRQIQAEVARLRAELDAIGGLRFVEHEGCTLKVITVALHDRLCPARIASPQEGTDPELLHCACCGFCHLRPARKAVDRYASNMRAAGLDVTVTQVAPGQVRVSGRVPGSQPDVPDEAAPDGEGRE